MRSLLFVPGDSERKLEKAAASGADAIIVDLEDSVAAERKPAAREIVRAYLAGERGPAKRFVRVNPLAGEFVRDDLAGVVPGGPDGIMLPKCAGADDVRVLDRWLTALEKQEGLPEGRIAILPIVTETAAAMFTLGGYAGASPRLAGLMWGAEDLAADIGAAANRTADGAYEPPFALARWLTVFAAAAAGVPAVDTVYADFKDLDGLARETREGARLGFSAKAAIHPAQVPVINQAFTPDAAAVAWARDVVGAFAAAPGAGVASLGGKMIDRPHLRAAERILARLPPG